MIVKRIVFFFAILLLPAVLMAQDSLVVFSEVDFIELILDNHPVANQAELLNAMARQEIRAAKGTLDPKWQTTLDQKTFKGTDYWKIWSHELKIPIWTNTDLKVGLDRASGTYVSEENINTADGLAYAGISIPLLQGMFTDARRTAIRQAQLMPQMADAEKLKLINKLLLEAIKDYWSWSNSYRQYTLQIEGVTLAEFRFNGIRERVLNGDAAPIDSVEALITLETRQNDLRIAEVEYRNSGISLSNYLWNEEGIALELNDNAIPESVVNIKDVPQTRMVELMEVAAINHPDLIKVNLKGQQLTLERKLNIEMLKPYIGFNYNFLTIATNVSIRDHQLFENNYKLGLNASVPLFLRKERAKLAMTNIKITENDLSEDYLTRKVKNDIMSTYNMLVTSISVIATQRDIVVNYETLREGELLKFANGESSLFLVNTRETKLLESRAKLIKAESDYKKGLATLYWAAGMTQSVLVD